MDTEGKYGNKREDMQWQEVIFKLAEIGLSVFSYFLYGKSFFFLFSFFPVKEKEELS